jgi:hypothetical protein
LEKEDQLKENNQRERLKKNHEDDKGGTQRRENPHF